jgi:hypothetical protein
LDATALQVEKHCACNSASALHVQAGSTSGQQLQRATPLAPCLVVVIMFSLQKFARVQSIRKLVNAHLVLIRDLGKDARQHATIKPMNRCKGGVQWQVFLDVAHTASLHCSRCGVSTVKVSRHLACIRACIQYVLSTTAVAAAAVAVSVAKLCSLPSKRTALVYWQRRVTASLVDSQCEQRCNSLQCCNCIQFVAAVLLLLFALLVLLLLLLLQLKALALMPLLLRYCHHCSFQVRLHTAPLSVVSSSCCKL